MTRLDDAVHVSHRDVCPPECVSALDPDLPCCYGSALNGPTGCTCWRPVYDLTQTEPVQGEPVTAGQMCSDCAYRPGSPERNHDPRQACSRDGELDEVALRESFWCHAGMRRVVQWRHETLDLVVDAEGICYEPAIVDGIPYRADGRPADRCAGAAARRRQLLSEVES